MPLAIKIGDVIPIPCRHCGNFIRSSAANSFLKCAKCGGITVLRVEVDADGVRVFTEGVTSGASVRPIP